jgi:hypothetical protein
MVHTFARPELCDHIECLVEHCAAILMNGVLAHVVELWCALAASDPEHEPTSGQLIDGCRFACELLRAPPGYWRDGCPDRDSGGGLCDSAERYPTVDHGVLESPDVVQMKKPSQPLSSASIARDTMVDGSPHEPKLGM